MSTVARRAVFLDRDGVVIEDADYLRRVDQVRLIPGVAAAIARLNHAGLPVIVVTNQSGVAKGLFAESLIGEVHAEIDRQLAVAGAHIDRYYYCPHHPTQGLPQYTLDCQCRKPRPGMLISAAHDLNLDLPTSLLVGDKVSDLQAGAAVGCQTWLVRTGHGCDEAATLTDVPPGCRGIVADLPTAVQAMFAEVLNDLRK